MHLRVEGDWLMLAILMRRSNTVLLLRSTLSHKHIIEITNIVKTFAGSARAHVMFIWPS